MATKSLPEDLLSQIKRARIRHRNYEGADRLIRHLLTFANDGTIILFLGPSKSGKTAEIEDLCADHPPVGDRIPMIVTDATTTGNTFSILHLTYRLLAELGHPLFLVEDIAAWKQSKGAPKIPETRARILLENGLILRECLYIAIDECQQMVKSMTVNKATHIIESFKCLMHLPASLRMGTRLPHLAPNARRIGILCGGYAMLDDGLRSTHFMNRIVPVHLARYKDTEEDRNEFARALMTLDEIFRADLRPRGSLIDFDDLIYHGIFGCFGNACNWALLAVAMKRAQRDRYLKAEHFAETRLDLNLEETLAEIIAGEIRMGTICKDFCGYDVLEGEMEKSAKAENKDGHASGRKPRRPRSKAKPRRYKVPKK